MISSFPKSRFYLLTTFADDGEIGEERPKPQDWRDATWEMLIRSVRESGRCLAANQCASRRMDMFFENSRTWHQKIFSRHCRSMFCDITWSLAVLRFTERVAAAFNFHAWFFEKGSRANAYLRSRPNLFSFDSSAAGSSSKTPICRLPMNRSTFVLRIVPRKLHSHLRVLAQMVVMRKHCGTGVYAGIAGIS